VRAGSRRHQLDATLRAAYGEGLLSEGTFVERVGELMTPGAVNPQSLVGDLTLRPHRSLAEPASELLRRLRRLASGSDRGEMRPLLALDWHAGEASMLVGRGDGCDLQLFASTVSRRHAQLLLRDGAWIVHDLGSRNGTLLNGRRVGRARLRPGDLLSFAEQSFRVD
jgi:hypothetical protein